LPARAKPRRSSKNQEATIRTFPNRSGLTNKQMAKSKMLSKAIHDTFVGNGEPTKAERKPAPAYQKSWWSAESAAVDGFFWDFGNPAIGNRPIFRGFWRARILSEFPSCAAWSSQLIDRSVSREAATSI